MLGISQKRDDLTRCRYCGEKLSLLQRLSRAEFCNPQHRDAYQRDQEQLAIGRLQQVVAEGREAEVFARLGRDRLSEDRLPEVEQAGAWPEEIEDAIEAPAVAAAPVAAPAAVAPLAEAVRAVAARRLEPAQQETPAEPGPPLCGPIYGSETVASGGVRPALPGGQSIETPPTTVGRIPATPSEATPLRVPTAHGVELGFTVPLMAGERRGREFECRDEQTNGPMRFPALSIQSVDWNEAIARERQSWAGIPPLAGLIQIAGPQTLRFEPRPRSPMPLPEHPSGNPVRAYKPGLARGSGMPGLAGAIGGLGTWRTRFGSEGNMLPQWEGDLLEASLTPDWKPRYPVFYTTKPWDGEGLEQIFGLGPGNGPGPDMDFDEPAPRAVDAPLAYRMLGQGEGEGEGGGRGDSALAGQLDGGTAHDGQHAAGEAGGGDGNHPVAAAGSGGADGADGSHAGNGRGSGSEQVAGAGPGGGGYDQASSAIPGAGAGFGGGGPEPGGGGSGDGRGVVSVEAVAALVKAARQSDRARTPLRDIDVRLMTYQAAPRLAAGRRWRGLLEGAARDLPQRGPIRTKARYDVPAVSLKSVCQSVEAERLSQPAPECTRPVFAALPEPHRPVLNLSLVRDWGDGWLAGMPGLRGLKPAGEGECEFVAQPCPPTHVAAPLVTGRAGDLQIPALLPEPWVAVQAMAQGLEQRQPEAAAIEPGLPKLPAGSGAGLCDRPARLELGAIEPPGSRWVLLRGGEHGLTFRMSLDHLRHSDPGELARPAEWGPVGSHTASASPARAHLTARNGFVHRELSLQDDSAEPFLEPLVCQFGSARGGPWDSRM